jgi:uncharacterized protein (DUF3084 family)
MQSLSRILLIFVTAASLAFMAFAGALVTGGPDWIALANSTEVSREVAITPPVVPNGPWTATHRLSGSSVSSNPIVAQVVTDAQKRVLDDLKQQLQAAGPELESLKAQLDGARQVNERDLPGIELRFAESAARLKVLTEQIQKTTDELEAGNLVVATAQRELATLRDEVYRLQAVLELLRDDLFAAEAQRQALKNELMGLQESQRRLERRNQQLQQQIQGEKYEAP